MEVIDTTLEELLPFMKLYVAGYAIGEILVAPFAIIVAIVMIVFIIKSFGGKK